MPNDCNLEDYTGEHRQCDKDIERLEAENATLRKQISALTDKYKELCNEYDALREAND